MITMTIISTFQLPLSSLFSFQCYNNSFISLSRHYSSFCYSTTVQKQSKLSTYLIRLFKQTFPSETNIQSQMETRKSNAILFKSQIKEISDAEIFQYESSIPQWKRSAIAIVESSQSLSSSSKAKFKRLKHYLKCISKCKSIKLLTSIYRSSDLHTILTDLNQSYLNLKYNLKFTGNPIIMQSRDLIEKLHFKSPISHATEIMKKYHPNFDICSFEKEMKIVLKQMFSFYMNDDIKSLQMICGESAYAMLGLEIKNRKEKSAELRYKQLLFLDEPACQSAEIIDQENVIMRVKVSIQECTGIVDKKTRKVIDKGTLESNTYMIDVIRNPVPFEEELGHSYMVVNFQKIESTIQLF